MPRTYSLPSATAYTKPEVPQPQSVIEESGANVKISKDMPAEVDTAAVDVPAGENKNVTADAEDQQQQQQQQHCVSLPTDIENFSGLTDEEFERLPRPKLDNCFYKSLQALTNLRSKLGGKLAKYIALVIVALLAIVYVSICVWQYAVSHRNDAIKAEASIRLFWTCGIIVLLLLIRLIGKYFGDTILEFTASPRKEVKLFAKRFETAIQIYAGAVAAAIILGFLIWVTVQNPNSLMSAVGMLVLVLIAFLLCQDHAMIQWQPVIGGIVLQFIFAALVLRTSWGYAAFNFFGDRVSEFLVHCDVGAAFVFGDGFREHFFAFSVLSVVIFFSSVISILFHLGILQGIIHKVGLVMQFVMGTTAAESLVAAANIFIGQTESPMMIRPFLKTMTNSELHSVMTSGFATIAGGVLAAYISMGVPARHLLGASVMSAPAALAISKLMWPETKQTLTSAKDVKKVKLQKFTNVVEAAGVGAMMSLKTIGAIAVNVLAFIAILAFVNATLTWLGHRAGLEIDLTFDYIASYALWPIAFVMGVAPIDCRTVAQLIGLKTFINEFVAYQRLGQMKTNYATFLTLIGNSSATADYVWRGGDVFIPSANATLIGGVIFEDKSLVIATYSLCGFSNLASIGLVIGALTAMAPKRGHDIVKCSVSAMVAGNIACFLTASIAGLFYTESA